VVPLPPPAFNANDAVCEYEDERTVMEAVKSLVIKSLPIAEAENWKTTLPKPSRIYAVPVPGIYCCNTS